MIYNGLVCLQHPELSGQRRDKQGRCVGCQKDWLKKYYQTEKGKAAKAAASKRQYEEGNKKQILADYRRENSRKRMVAARMREDRIVRATPSWADLKVIEQVYIDCPDGFHVDHVIPLRGELVCGLHVENNLQYLPALDNILKSNKISGSPV